MNTEGEKEMEKMREAYRRQVENYILWGTPYPPIMKDRELMDYYLRCIAWEEGSRSRGVLRRYKE